MSEGSSRTVISVFRGHVTSPIWELNEPCSFVDYPCQVNCVRVCLCLNTMKPEPHSSFNFFGIYLCVLQPFTADEVLYLHFYPLAVKHIWNIIMTFINYTISDGHVREYVQKYLFPDWMTCCMASQVTRSLCSTLWSCRIFNLPYWVTIKVNTSFQFCKSIEFPHSVTVICELNAY